MAPASHRWLIAVVLLATAGDLRGQDAPVGTRVVTKYRTPLRAGPRVVDDDRTFRVYTVERADGGWLWLTSGSVRGWAPAGAVVPFDRAIDFYTQEVRADPANAAAYNKRGMVWQVKGEPDRAIADYTEAIRLDPNQAEGFIARGVAWRAKGEYDKAIADYTEAIRLDPNQADAFHNRGNAWRTKRELDRAIADYTEAIRLDPNQAEGFIARGLAWSDKQEHDRAIADCTEAIRLDPKYAMAFFTRGLAWSDKQEHDRAIADYTEAIRLDPEYAMAFFNRGNTRSAKRERDRAIADYTEAIRLDPKNPNVFVNRGWVRYLTKDYDNALADYTEAIRLDPERATAFANRAWLWATCPDVKYRDGRRAVASATRLCERTEWKDAYSLGTLAAAYAEAGDFEKAAESQEKANARFASEGDRERGQQRLALYRDGKPYREEPGPEEARERVAHGSPKTTKLYDRTSDQITLDEIERIAI